jgi:hypothetical protein
VHFASLYLHHIGLVYIVICIIHLLFMHFRWFTGLSYKVSSSIFNFWETENLLFLYFAISGTFWTSNWSGIFIALIFYHEKHLGRLKQTRGATRIKRAWVTRPTMQVAPPVLGWPLSIVSSSSFYGCLRFDRKGTPYFSHNFMRRRWRRNPSFTSGRADLLLLPEGNRRHIYHRLLLGIGGASLSHLHHHLHHTQHQHHLHLEIRRHSHHNLW